MRVTASDTVTVYTQSGGTVLLSSDLRRWRVEDQWDVRWTHRHLVLSLKNNMTTCHHGRCELLSDGSLRFSPVHIQDSGNYSLQVFDRGGTRVMRTDFLLRVEGESMRHQQTTPGL
ncbi:Hypothetical protein SMAX5B_021537 [Scophthalmus maximus]|uniref:Immunoglobulin subtype domain-containing protein n=1 Tax=Scophthalmus maximus TaxID=52904 RepID=A0A2U9B6Y0_SCOMX|nr:Hypothetical protein SMAX5B_021537 [Scophthalmus maximus]